MHRFAVVLAAAACAFAAGPKYSASSLVNAASNKAGPLSPNTIVSLYGTDLSWDTGQVSGAQDGYLPYHLTSVGTTVLVNAVPAGLFYVSPTQINFLVSAQIVPGPVRIQVVRDGWAGPEVELLLEEVSPALFQLDPDYAVATRADGSVITRESPARPGEIVILYANGLGPTKPLPYDREIPRRAARIERLDGLSVWLDGVEVPRENIQYAGAAPNFAGLYQINLLLPPVSTKDPEIRIGFPEAVSPAKLRLPMTN